MKDIKVVIGANFGDEGKGLMTDYYASKAKKGIVVRFNGGAQAGHTVVTPEGKRHVFGHFGSGTLANLPTYLSSFFVVNPLLFVKELKDLEDKGISPKIYIDKYCLVSTPYDMMINQIAEISRGDKRHGSCGVGFSETIVRSQRDDLRIIASNFSEASSLRDKLDIIRGEYVYNRLKDLGIEKIPDNFKRFLDSKNIVERFIQDMELMFDTAGITKISVLRGYDSIIFEGAQGLLLDQDRVEYYPHVTHSNTGLKNVRDLLFEADLEDENIEVTYVTRCYLTRRDTGPLHTELKKKPYKYIEDATNVPNQFQGVLRFGHLDLDLLGKSIKDDLKYVEGLKYECNVAVTCLDQIESKVTFYANKELRTEDISTFLSCVWELAGADHVYSSYGPTREYVLPAVIPTPV